MNAIQSLSKDKKDKRFQELENRLSNLEMCFGDQGK